MRPTEILPWITVVSLGDGILPAMHIKGFVLCSGFRRNWSHSCFCIILNPLGYLGYGRLRRGKIDNSNNSKSNNTIYVIAGYVGEMHCVYR